MTGAFARILREGRWVNIEIDQFTDEELEDFAKKSPDAGWKWAKLLAAWIRDNVKQKVKQKPQ